jgi:hypothetical protein
MAKDYQDSHFEDHLLPAKGMKNGCDAGRTCSTFIPCAIINIRYLEN